MYTPVVRIRPGNLLMVLDHTVKVDGVALWETGGCVQTPSTAHVRRQMAGAYPFAILRPHRTRPDGRLFLPLH